MKKLFLIIALIAISLPAFSQVKVRPGFRLGLNAATITNHEDSERKIGFDGAIFANIHFTSFYELQPELTYSNQGFKRRNIIYYTGSGTNEIGGGFNIHYIGLSVANKFFVVPNSGLHFIIGPSIEVNVSDDSQYNDITPIDFSLFGGVGYEFPMGLGIEARFKQGLIDVRKDYYDDPNYHDDNELYNYNNKLNSVFQLNVYYKFNFNK